MNQTHNTIRPYLDTTPEIGNDCYIDPTAVLIGDIVLADQVSIWPYAVIRADVNSVRIGARSNIQDLSMLHVSHKNDAKPEGSPLIIGEDVTIGHHVMLHGCTIGDRVLVGMGTTIMDDAIIESDVMIGACSLVPPRKRLQSGFLYVGSPVKQVRPLTDEEKAGLLYSSQHYQRVAANHILTAEQQSASSESC